MGRIITGFVVSLILVGLFMGVFQLYFAQISSNYGISVYSNASMVTYNKLRNLSQLSEEVKEESESIQTKSGITDILGEFFNNGYRVLKIVAQSYDTSEAIVDQSLDDMQLDVGGSLFKTALKTIIILVIFLAIISLVIAKASDQV